MKQLWQDYNRVIILAAIALPLLAAALIWVATDKPADPIRLTVPDAGEVTACYYIPDMDKPYEQEWLGGEKLEAALSELAALEFKAADAPDEDSVTACLVIATNDEQITVHVDESDTCWVFYEGRWMHELP